MYTPTSFYALSNIGLLRSPSCNVLSDIWSRVSVLYNKYFMIFFAQRSLDPTIATDDAFLAVQEQQYQYVTMILFWVWHMFTSLYFHVLD